MRDEERKKSVALKMTNKSQAPSGLYSRPHSLNAASHVAAATSAVLNRRRFAVFGSVRTVVIPPVPAAEPGPYACEGGTRPCDGR